MSQKAIDLIRIDQSSDKYIRDITEDSFFGYPIQPIIESEEKLLSEDAHSVAYFSMEYGLAPSVYHEFKSVNKTSNANIMTNHEVFSNMLQMDYFHYLPVKKIPIRSALTCFLLPIH